MDFTQSTKGTEASASSDATRKIRADMRGSSMRSKRAQAIDVNLEDFDVTMQLG